jgi:hypothetical protein
LVQKKAAASTANAAANTSAPPSYPRPVSSAVQSPRAVPNVWDSVMATQ